MASNSQSSRGTGWVAMQVVLLVAIFLVPARIGSFIVLPEPINTLVVILGLLVGIAGLFVIAISARDLGGSLSVFPRPVEGGTLTDRGIYGLVRHPMYLGVVLSALGWSLFRTSIFAVVLTIVLLIFFSQKAAREEKWLAEKYPDYESYRQRVRHKLIPWVF